MIPRACMAPGATFEQWVADFKSVVIHTLKSLSDETVGDSHQVLAPKIMSRLCSLIIYIIMGFVFSEW